MIEEELLRAAKPAYLFVGSGFSRRYIGLETWADLLKKFAVKNYALYSGKAKGNLPLVAKYIADDFFEEIYNNGEAFAAFLEKYSDLIGKDGANSLKCRISEYLNEYLNERQGDLLDNAEIISLTKARIDGVITTNWDCSLELIFPKFSTFVGQEELLFKNSYGVGEIYKIHGSASQPDSLILTDDDYERFEKSNAYIAAKLTTIFVEHPVVFIGYSISDSYLIDILSEIVKSLGDKRDRLSSNLFFLRRCKDGESAHCIKTHLPLKDISIPMTQIVTDDFGAVFDALGKIPRRIPPHVLRMLREQIYEITCSSEPEKRVALIDADDEESLDGIDFVAGFAVKQQYEKSIAEVGLLGLNRDDLMKDVVFSSSIAPPLDILSQVVPGLRKGRTFVPVYKYLHGVGVDSNTKFNELNLGWKKDLPSIDSYKNTDHYGFSSQEKTISQVIAEYQDRIEFAPKALLGVTPSNARAELGILEVFLKSNYGALFMGSYKSDFYKLICYFDHLKYGW